MKSQLLQLWEILEAAGMTLWLEGIENNEPDRTRLGSLLQDHARRLALTRKFARDLSVLVGQPVRQLESGYDLQLEEAWGESGCDLATACQSCGWI